MGQARAIANGRRSTDPIIIVINFLIGSPSQIGIAEFFSCDE
jgi:hypothetical protein